MHIFLFIINKLKSLAPELLNIISQELCLLGTFVHKDSHEKTSFLFWKPGSISSKEHPRIELRCGDQEKWRWGCQMGRQIWFNAQLHPLFMLTEDRVVGVRF